MTSKQTSRFAFIVGVLLLFLIGWWQLGGLGGQVDTIEPGAGATLNAGAPAARTAIAPSTPDPVVDEEPRKGTPKEPQPGPRRKPVRNQDSVDPLDFDSKLPPRENIKGTERNWIAVDEFGRGLADSAWILMIEKDGMVRPVEVTTDKKGRFGLHPSKLPADVTFTALLSKDGTFVAELLGQEVHKPLQKELVVRAVGAGHLHIRWVPADAAQSKLRYSALLFAQGQSKHGFIPVHTSDRSRGMDVDMDVAPGIYELVLVPEGGILHGVIQGTREKGLSAVQIHIQPGGITSLHLHEPQWNEAKWLLNRNRHPESMTMSLVGVPMGQPLMYQPGIAPEWRRAVRPTAQTPYLIWPKQTLARVSRTGGDHRFALLRDGSMELIQGHRSERDIQLDFLAGEHVRTTIQSLTQVPTHLEFMQPQLEDVNGRISLRTPNWIKVEAEYANDTAWSKAVATVTVHPNKKKLKLGSAIKPHTLDLDKPEIGRATPPSNPGLRWSYDVVNSAISHLAVDLLPSSSQHIEVPMPNNPRSEFLGTLSWTPDSTPGALAIGAWQVNPKRRKKNETPGFRTFHLQCVQSSGAPAPFAMVQARGIADQLRWKGTADNKGMLRLEVLGSGPFWIDSGLVQNPVQIQLHGKSDQTKVLKLMVPMRHNRIDMFVSGEEDFDLSQLTVRLNLWKQPKEFPGRTYPDIAQGHLDADGQISFQSLVPALYRLELFNHRFPNNVRSRKVRINDRDSNPQIMMHWRP